jgi:hypothetical protein
MLVNIFTSVTFFALKFKKSEKWRVLFSVSVPYQYGFYKIYFFLFLQTFRRAKPTEGDGVQCEQSQQHPDALHQWQHHPFPLLFFHR